MKELKCLFGHKWEFAKVFTTSVIDEEDNIVCRTPVATGMQCPRCGRRRVVYSKSVYAKAATVRKQDIIVWSYTGIDPFEDYIAPPPITEEPHKKTTPPRLVVHNG